MRGVITGRDVVQNGHTILREYGPRCFFRCMLSVLLGRRTTFLEIAFADHCKRP